MFASIMLIIGGLFACYGLIISKAPHLKDEFDKVIPFQGIFGIILLILGIIDLIYFGRTLLLFQSSIIFGILQLLNMITKFVLGFVLSYGLVTKYLLTPKTASSEDLQQPTNEGSEEGTTTTVPSTEHHEATQKVYNTLILVQVPFGILALLLGLIGLIVNIIY